jgi:hypothetical protein
MTRETEVAAAPATPYIAPTSAEAEPDRAPVQTATVDDDVTPPDDAAVPEEGAAADPAEDTDASAAPANVPEEPPETTASADATAAVGDATPAPVARLPRQRPKPPARVLSSASPTGAQPSTLDEQRLRLARAPTLPRQYGPRLSPYYDPMTPHPNLTPAEYQVLLARRAWVQNYAARRRALAEWRARQRYDDESDD